MPRGGGKKKDKKKDEIPFHKLSLEDTSQASTSEGPRQSHDEDVGLTSGGRKKKESQKEQPASMDICEDIGVEQQKSEPSKPDEAASPPPDTDSQKRKDDDDGYEGLGLGLGGSKKNRRKKKKPDNIAASSSSSQAAPQPVPQPAPPPVQRYVPPPLRHVPQQVPQHVPQHVPQPATPAVSERAIKTEDQMQPRVGTSGTQLGGYGRGSGTRREVGPMCLFKIPDKIPGRSVPCRQLKLLANYLEMTIQPLKIHRYDIMFKPDKPRKFLSAAYTMAVKKNFGNILLAFDQRKNIYSLSALPGVSSTDRFKCEVKVRDTNDKWMNFEVSFKFTGIVDLSTIITYMTTGGTTLSPPTEAIQAVDVILRQGTLESYVKAGRQFFKRPSRPIDLGDGLEMWTGLFQSAIFTSRPFVNIDVAHKGFPRSQLLLDAFTRDFRLDTSKAVGEQRGRGVEGFLHYLKGLKVTAYIGGDIQKGPQREFIVNELVDSPRKMFFKMNEGTPQENRISVLDYFEKDKKCRIRYPNLNCVWVGPRDKRIYYPMELLMVSYGQVCNKQLTELQLSTLVRESATPPQDRKRKIEEVISDMNYSKSEYFKKFGLNISNHFVSVDAKVLQPPKLEVGGTAVEPRRGVWQAKRLHKPQHLDSWGLISVDTDPRNSFDSIINMIIGIGSDMGMNVKSPSLVSFNVRVTELMRTLQTVKDKGIHMLFVVISTRGKDYYHKLKRMAEREVGVLTQCIKEFTATRKMNEQTIRNIMLKVNSKLMGINHALDARSTPMCLQQGKVMMVGADVTHPSPDQSSVPSIAAVTASIDPKFTIYNLTLSVQTPKKEMIVDFEDMMVEHLNEFEKRQRELPSKIFVFRDGVSEGQFAQVMNSELQAVHNAYKRKIGPGSNRRPEVLFLLVQKRHHTRFFLGDSTFNVEPGTVVDSHIVHPKELDFYLVSHQAIKGTARPTRYHAVCNDGRIAQDEVEQLTYYLCHLYARCTRAVSYPTPTYYAHLACMRARSLTFGDRFSNADLEKSPQRLRVLERILEASKMFFV